MKHISHFITAYTKAHPETPMPPNSDDKLIYVWRTYEAITRWVKYVHNGYEYYMDNRPFFDGASVEGTAIAFDKHKLLWLFSDIPFEDIDKKLTTLMIERNDPTLSEKDYSVLLFLSCHGEKMKDAWAGVPLNMVYEGLLPLAEKIFDAWIENK
jgi:hypothetical protein